MARRRLSPLSSAGEAEGRDVPHAEHFPFPDNASSGISSSPGLPSLSAALHGPGPSAAPGLPSAPIARVAAEAAGSAALQELADTLMRARETGRLVLDLPLGAIAPDHLARDRLPAEDEEMAALRESLRAHGQRTPIEVVALTGPKAATGAGAAYGLISGWRRLTALKTLLAETGEARFATVQALVRRPETAAEAYVAMVEENELRVGLSQYERARVAARAVERGVFPDEKAALLALFATASRPKRSRIRAFLEIYHALDAELRFPAAIPERLGLALVEALRAGRGPAVAAALAAAPPATAEAELALLESITDPLVLPPEAEEPARPEQPDVPRAEHPAPPRDGMAPRPLGPGLALTSRLGAGRLTLTLTGRAVDSALAARIEAALAALLVPVAD